MNQLDKLKILGRLFLEKSQPKVFSFHDCLPDIFSSYIELLVTKRFKILSGQEMMEGLTLAGRSGAARSQAKEAVLTFDDGRRNCWTVIFPLLKKYKIRALFFIIPSRIKDTAEYYPNLEDYWKGRVSWENLYVSHRRMPYLTWSEIATMQASGLVDICSHGLKHDVVRVSSEVIDFQHPGVFEMPVYFDEWFDAGEPLLDYQWGAPIYERAWAPFAANGYIPDRRADTVMNEFVKKSGGFLFFKKKNWRKRLFDHYASQKLSFARGHFEKLKEKEDAFTSLVASKEMIEKRTENPCPFFSIPLYQGSPEIYKSAEEAGYKAVFAGTQGSSLAPNSFNRKQQKFFLLSRIPSFWIKFLAYI
jgi:hypothetical protein